MAKEALALDPVHAPVVAGFGEGSVQGNHSWVYGALGKALVDTCISTIVKWGDCSERNVEHDACISECVLQ